MILLYGRLMSSPTLVNRSVNELMQAGHPPRAAEMGHGRWPCALQQASSGTRANSTLKPTSGARTSKTKRASISRRSRLSV